MLYIVGDLHFGMRKNHKTFHSILLQELSTIQDKVTKNDSIVFLGDIFDSRSSVDYQVLNDAWDFFIELSRKVKEIFILVGNHDLYYRENKMEYVNCRFLRLDLGSQQAANLYIMQELSERNIQGKLCLFVPWIDNVEQKEKVIQQLKKKKYDIIFGHFDSFGLYDQSADNEMMFDGEKDFGKADFVLSGHFHKRCERGHVKYLGSLINSTYNDVGEIKGFYCLNDVNELEFIQGSCPRFEYIHINDTNAFIKMIEAISDEQRTQLSKRISGNFIKLFFHEYNKQNEDVYAFIKSFEPMDISIGYDIQQFEEELEEGFDGFDSKTDITEVIHTFLDKMEEQIPTGIEMNDLKSIVESSHQKFKQEQEAI